MDFDGLDTLSAQEKIISSILPILDRYSDAANTGKLVKLAVGFMNGSVDLADEYDQAVENAARYSEAARIASDAYYRQMQVMFRTKLENVDRKVIGIYAQDIWTRFCGDMAKEYEYNDGKIEFTPKLFPRGVEKSNDPVLQSFAQISAFHAMNWICMNINEIPVGRTPEAHRPPRHRLN